MRFVLVDRILRIDEGRRIVGVTTFPPSADVLADHFERSPIVPGTLIVEAMVQTLAWGIIHAHDFRLIAMLSLFEDASFATPRLPPGECACVTGEIISTSETDSLGRAWLEVDGTRMASIERIIYSHVAVENPAHLRDLFATLTAPPTDRCPGEESSR